MNIKNLQVKAGRRLSKKNKNTRREKITSTLKSKKYIAFAYIFGSFALSSKDSLKENTFNDIDIAIYLSKGNAQDSLSLELELENELEGILHIPVDVRIINNAPLSFQYNILKTGIVIVDRDKTLRADFEGLIFKKYFDFVHLRNEYLRETLNAQV